MPCVKRCCCCVTLRLGGITMGIMTLALSVFSIIPMAISFVQRVFLAQVVTHLLNGMKLDEENEAKPDQPDVAFWGVVKLISTQDGISQLPPTDDEKVADLANVMFYFFIICIILLGIYLICSILVIIGAAKAKRWLMLPWIVGTFLFLLAYLGGVIVSIYLIGTSRYEILLLLGFAIVEAAIGFYLWVCIVSLFQVLGSDEFRNGGGANDWELKPRFTTSYNAVPQHD